MSEGPPPAATAAPLKTAPAGEDDVMPMGGPGLNKFMQSRSRSSSPRAGQRDVTPDPAVGIAAAEIGLVGAGHAQKTDKGQAFGGMDGAQWPTVPFQVPSEADAKDAGEESMLAGGRAPLCGTKVNDFSEFGEGAPLYFKLLRLLAAFFFIASISIVPAGLLYTAGGRYSADEVDSAQLVRTMLGNLGPSAPTGNASTSPLEAALAYRVTMPIVGGQWTWFEVSVAAAYADVAYSILFLGVILVWVGIVAAAEHKQQTASRAARASDYTVWVRGLPKTATAGEVRAHFDALYNLWAKDWTHTPGLAGCYCHHKPHRRRQFLRQAEAEAEMERWHLFFPNGPPTVPRIRACHCCAEPLVGCRRPAVVGDPEGPPADWRDFATRPVHNASNTADDSYLHSWVAEVTLATRNGSVLRRFARLERMRRELLRCRAAIRTFEQPAWKATSPSTCACLDGGSDPSCAAGPCLCTYLYCGSRDSRLLRAQRRLDSIQRRLLALDRARPALSKHTVGAFVIFNNEESWRRAVQDYAGSDAWYANAPLCGTNAACQPGVLRFKGRAPLTVVPAPEPDDVIWENLETGACERAARITLTNLCMLLFLAASLAAILLSQRQLEAFNDVLPGPGVCSTQAPSIAYGAGLVPPSPTLVRSPDLQPLCEAVEGPGHVYVWWEGLAAPPNLTVSLANITDAGGAVVDTVPNPCSTPCIPSDLDASAPCVAPAGTGEEGGAATPTFPVRNVLGCFCLDTLQAETEAQGAFTGALEVLQSQPLCASLATSFAAAQGLVVFAAAGVVIINTLLQGVLSAVTQCERHDTRSAAQYATARKLFFALFLNTGLIVLLVHARIPGGAALTGGVLSGNQDSLGSKWYTGAGLAVALTMAINVVAPHLGVALRLVTRPLCRRCCSGRRLLQQDLNDTYQPPPLRLETRVPHIMNTVAVSLLYSPGIPLLIPLAAVALMLHFAVDWYLALRVLGRPPPASTAMARLARSIMPIALLAHCGFAVWFYGDPDASTVTPLIGQGAFGDPVPGWVQSLRSTVTSTAGTALVSRVFLASAFPSALLFLLLFLVLLFRYTCGSTALELGRICCAVVSRGRCGAPTAAGAVDRHLPPYTATYNEPVPTGHTLILTPAARAEGWRVIMDNRRGVGAEQRVKLGRAADAPALRGGRYKLTWQVVGEAGVPSYTLSAAPRYTLAVRGIRDGVMAATGTALGPAPPSPRPQGGAAVTPSPSALHRVASAAKFVPPKPYGRAPAADYSGGLLSRKASGTGARGKKRPPPRAAWTLVGVGQGGADSMVSNRLGVALPDKA